MSMLYPMLGSCAAEAQGLQPCRAGTLAAQAEHTDKGSCRGRAPCSPAPARLLDAHTSASHAHSQAAACSRTAVLSAAAAALEPQALRRDPALQQTRQCRVGEAIWTSPDIWAPAHRAIFTANGLQQCICKGLLNMPLQLSTTYNGLEIHMESTHAGQFLHQIGLRGWRSRCRCRGCLRWQGIKGLPS